MLSDVISIVRTKCLISKNVIHDVFHIGTPSTSKHSGNSLPHTTRRTCAVGKSPRHTDTYPYMCKLLSCNSYSFCNVFPYFLIGSKSEPQCCKPLANQFRCKTLIPTLAKNTDKTFFLVAHQENSSTEQHSRLALSCRSTA